MRTVVGRVLLTEDRQVVDGRRDLRLTVRTRTDMDHVVRTSRRDCGGNRRVAGVRARRIRRRGVLKCYSATLDPHPTGRGVSREAQLDVSALTAAAASTRTITRRAVGGRAATATTTEGSRKLVTPSCRRLTGSAAARAAETTETTALEAPAATATTKGVGHRREQSW